MIPNNVQQDVADEVNDRLTKATRELQEKYARGEGGKDVSVDGPSGTAYKDKHNKEMEAKKKARAAKKASEEQDGGSNSKAVLNEDEEEEEGEDEDHEVRRIREQRLRQLKAQRLETLENIGKGHGQYREVVQDEFLAEVTSSVRVICHFYHKDFPRCEIMNMHLMKLVQRHVETKFIRIDAEKAPFFVEKLKIRTIPSVIIFHDGVAVEKILGFEGLADLQPVGKEDEWPTIRLARLLGSKGAIDKSKIVDDEGKEREAQSKLDSLRQQFISHTALNDNDDDELFADD